MKNTTAARLQQVMSERNLKQVDVISLSKVHQKELGFWALPDAEKV